MSLWRKRNNVQHNEQKPDHLVNILPNLSIKSEDLSIKSKEHMKKTYDHELVKRMIDEAVKAEREACSVDAEWCIQNHLEQHIPKRIRARGQT
jgi:hypothetical protein